MRPGRSEEAAAACWNTGVGAGGGEIVSMTEGSTGVGDLTLFDRLLGVGTTATTSSSISS